MKLPDNEYLDTRHFRQKNKSMIQCFEIRRIVNVL